MEGTGVIVDKLRIVVAEEHIVVKAIITTLLDIDCEVIAGLDDGKQLIQAALSHAPDVIISDVSLKTMDGVAVRQELLSDGIFIPFVFVTSDAADCDSTPDQFAVGWVHKVDMVDELSAAVSAVWRGRCYVSKSLKPRQV
jgi:DNA-binding NarL/FixJ family response regulator